MAEYEALVCLWVRAMSLREARRIVNEQHWLNHHMREFPSKRYSHAKIIPLDSALWQAHISSVRVLGVMPYLDSSWESLGNKPMLDFVASVILSLESSDHQKASLFMQEAPWFADMEAVTVVNTSNPARNREFSTRIE